MCISSSTHPKPNSPSSPTVSVLPSVFPISVNDTIILPAAQTRSKSVFLASFFSFPPYISLIKKLVISPMQGSLLPSPVHCCCPSSHLLPSLWDQSPCSSSSPTKIFFFWEAKSVGIPLFKTFLGSSLISEINQKLLPHIWEPSSQNLTPYLPPQLIPCQPPKYTECSSHTKAFTVPMNVLCSAQSFSFI